VKVDLARKAVLPRRANWMRPLVAAVVLIVLSGLWHAGHSTLQYHAACGSIGNPYRTEHLSEELWRLYPGSDIEDEPGPRRERGLETGLLPEPWIAWRSQLRHPLLGVERKATWFADASFRLRGCIQGGLPNLETGPVDADGDGRWEVAVCLPLARDGGAGDKFIREWAIVRMDEWCNELVAAVATDEVVSSLNVLYEDPASWSNEDGEGPLELAFKRDVYTTLPSGRRRHAGTHTWAVLGWTRPGGALRVIQVEDSEGVLVWTPPDGEPWRVPTGQPLKPLLDQLLPIPDEWLAAPAEPDDTWGDPELEANGDGDDASAWDEQDEEPREDVWQEPSE